MLKIGEFSKLSLTTVKALRYYEREGLLLPSQIDRWTGYRFYETSQLETAARIRSYRQLGLTIEDIKSIFHGEDVRKILSERSKKLLIIQQETERQLSIIDFILEDKQMKYQVTMKELPEMIVYYSEATLKQYSDSMQWIPTVGQMCMELNPSLKCAEPPYEFCEYLDGEYQEQNIRIRHSEAVTAMGRENESIKFRILPPVKVLSIYHKGAYDNIGDAYAFIMEYAEKNGYEVTGLARESYINGIWNTKSINEWLTEVQLPVK
ncbi:MAG: MerR family transcriptional regulator [Oscillospiraceae bacterium]|nr:MerR family transcriptional regulator [Oscillospiraceae bacterium]